MARKATHETDRRSILKFEQIINVGPAMARDFQRLGLVRPQQLMGNDPVKLYQRICKLTNQFHDPCVLDTYMATVDYMNGNAPQTWWSFTEQRKRDHTKVVDALREKFPR